MSRATDNRSSPPSQEAFFIEGLDKPKFTDGDLTVAEIAQLAMDREGDPVVQGRLAWFCDEHLEEFKEFSSLLTEFEEAAEKLAGHEDAFRQIDQGDGEDELDRFITAMACGFIRTKRWALAQRAKSVTEIGEGLSTRLVTYIQAMFPDRKSMRIHGVPYSFEGGVLAAHGLSDNNKYLVIFGGESIVTAYNREHYMNMQPYKTHARRATPAEWQRLCQDLQTFAKF